MDKAGHAAVSTLLPGHLGSPFAAYYGYKLARQFGQPLRSRAAYHLPDSEAFAEGLGPSLGGMVGALDSRKGGDKLKLDKLKAEIAKMPAEAKMRLMASLGITE